MEENKFQIELDARKKKLQDCQKSKELKSCMHCEQFFDCKIREEYVKATYNSMSKGQTGGFEF